MRNCQIIPMFLSFVLAALQLGCGLDPPQRPAVTAGGRVGAGPGDHGPSAEGTSTGQFEPGCLPILGGELVINEVLARPAGLDLDGDGQSNHRDEALELRLVAQGPRHLQGVVLRVAGQLRGHLSGPTCYPPGTLLILVGSTTGSVALPQGSVQLNLSAQLALRDEGAAVVLQGPGGGLLDEVNYPPGPAGRSQVRTPEGNRWAPLQLHPENGTGSGHSIGLCSDGNPPFSCWAAETST